MPTYDRGFQLGLLPERKWNWRTFAASYGILVCLILLLIVVGIMVPDTLIPTVNYHVTELIPRPALQAGATAQAKAAASTCQVAAAGARISRRRN